MHYVREEQAVPPTAHGIDLNQGSQFSRRELTLNGVESFPVLRTDVERHQF